jgi:hypothetical protein
MPGAQLPYGYHPEDDGQDNQCSSKSSLENMRGYVHVKQTGGKIKDKDRTDRDHYGS